MDKVKTLVDTVVKAIQEKKGQDITIIDLRNIDGAIAQYFIVCQGNTPIQVDAIAGSVSDMCREELHEKPAGCVGLEEALWVAVDYVDVMVHIFVPDAREFYDLEHLWEDAPQTIIPNLD